MSWEGCGWELPLSRPCRIVCEMGEAKPSQHAGFVEICVAVCRPEFMARSSQLYYFMVSAGHNCWAFLWLCGHTQGRRLLGQSGEA